MSEVNHFKTLGLDERAVQDPAVVKARFHALSMERHPDISGRSAEDLAEDNEEAFSALTEAHQIVLSPARRLRHLLELKAGGQKVDLKGTVPDRLMDLFAAIGPALQKADGLLAEKELARTTLAEALLVDRIMENREVLEALNGQVEQEKNWVVDQFGGLDEMWDIGRTEPADDPDADAGTIAFLLGVSLCRSLLYLERWGNQILTRLHALTF